MDTVKENVMSDLDANIFVASYLKSIRANHRSELFDDEVEFNNLVRAAMKHALDVSINTFDAMPGFPINVNEVISILQKIKEGVK